MNIVHSKMAKKRLLFTLRTLVLSLVHCFCQKAFVRQQIVTDYSYFVLHVNSVSQRCIKSMNEIIFCTRCHLDMKAGGRAGSSSDLRGMYLLRPHEISKIFFSQQLCFIRIDPLPCFHYHSLSFSHACFG